MESTHLGGCHCGLVRFEVAGDLSRTLVCNCSICTKKGVLHLIVPPDRFRLVSGKDTLATYRFNTGVAKHLLCTASGVAPFYVPRSDPDKVDVNVRSLDGVELGDLRPTVFDGWDWEHTYERPER